MGLVWLQSLWPPYTRGASALTRMKQVWGWLRWPLFIVTAGLYLALDGSLLALFSQLLHFNFYARTPLWVFNWSVVAMVAWLAGKSVSQVARNVQFWFPLIIASFFLLTFLVLPNVHLLTAIRPSSVITIKPIAKGMMSTWYLWVQGEVIVTLGAHVRGTPWTRIRRWALGAIAFQGFMIMFIYALVVGTLGPVAPTLLEWPLVFIFSNFTAPTLFFSRPGLFVIISWVIALTLYVAVTLMVLTINVQDALSLSVRTRTVLVVATAIALGTISSKIATPLAANEVVLSWVDPIALGLTLFSSIFAPLLVRIRNLRLDAEKPRT